MKEITIIAGPNGSGKTTFSKQYLSQKSAIFLNADEIAASLETKDQKIFGQEDYFLKN